MRAEPRSACLLLVLASLVVACRGGGEELRALRRETAPGVRPPVFAMWEKDAARQGPTVAVPVPDDHREWTQEAERLAEALHQRLEAGQDARRHKDLATPPSLAGRLLTGDPAALIDPLRDGLTIAALDALLLARNPGVRAARESLEAAYTRLPQTAYVTWLLGTYRSFLAGMMPGVGPMLPTSVSADFPFPGVLALKGELVTQDVAVARAAYEQMLRDQVLAAEETFFEAWYLSRAIRLQRDLFDTLSQVEASAQAKVRTGAASQARVLQVQTELALQQERVFSLLEARENANQRLQQLLDLPPTFPTLVPRLPEDRPTVPAGLAALQALGAERAPEVSLAKARVGRMEAAVRLAEKMSEPDLAPGFSTFEGLQPVNAMRSAPQGVVPEGFQQRLRTPRTFWIGWREAFLREARARLRALEAGVVSARRAAELHVHHAHHLLEAAERRLELMEEVGQPHARQALTEMLAAYQADDLDLTTLLDGVRRALDADLQRDAALRDLFVGYEQLRATAFGELPDPEEDR